MKTYWELLKQRSVMLGAMLLPTALIIMALTWGQITSKPFVTIGDPGYPSFASSVITLNSAGTECTLLLPSGAHDASTVLAVNGNIKLQFMPGAYLDCTNSPNFHPSVLEASGGNLKVTTATPHGLITDDRIMFWNITQHGTPTAGGAAPEWMTYNFKSYLVKNVTTYTFTCYGSTDPSAFTAYDAGIDAGKFIRLTAIQGSIIAPLGSKIFECPNGPAICFGSFGGASNSYNKQIVTVYPEWWGAISDVLPSAPYTGTDCLAAFNNALWSLLPSYNTTYGKIILTDRYLLSGTFSIADIGSTYSSITIEGVVPRHSGIHSKSTNYPAIELLAPRNVYLKNLSIVGDSTSIPSVGLLMARSLIDTSEANTQLRDVSFTGSFAYGGLLNLNCETNVFEDIYIRITCSNPGFGMAFTKVMTDYPAIVNKNGSGFGSRTADGCGGNRIVNPTISSDVLDTGCLIYLNDSSVTIDGGYYAATNHSNVDIIRSKNSTIFSWVSPTVELSYTNFINILSDTSGTQRITVRGASGSNASGYYLYGDDKTVITDSIFESINDNVSVYSIYNSKITINWASFEARNRSLCNFIYLGYNVTGYTVPGAGDNNFGNAVQDCRTATRGFTMN
jgi:hypothetical protein